jgi:hypothetical protein
MHWLTISKKTSPLLEPSLRIVAVPASYHQFVALWALAAQWQILFWGTAKLRVRLGSRPNVASRHVPRPHIAVLHTSVRSGASARLSK